MLTEQDLYRGYRLSPPADRTVLGTVTLNVVEERIRELLGHRRWWRQHRWADWPAERLDTDRELRALVRLLREARRLAKPDPLTPDRGYHEWQAR